MESTIACQLQSILIGSRLDTDIHANTCRLAFYGHVLDGFTDSDYVTKDLPTRLRIYKRKEKIGFIDRIVDGQTLIGKDLFQKDTNINAFVNFKVELSPTGEQGFIESPFGQSGKFKVRFMSKTTFSFRFFSIIVVVFLNIFQTVFQMKRNKHLRITNRRNKEQAKPRLMKTMVKCISGFELF